MRCSEKVRERLGVLIDVDVDEALVLRRLVVDLSNSSRGNGTIGPGEEMCLDRELQRGERRQDSRLGGDLRCHLSLGLPVVCPEQPKGRGTHQRNQHCSSHVGAHAKSETGAHTAVSTVVSNSLRIS